MSDYSSSDELDETVGDLLALLDSNISEVKSFGSFASTSEIYPFPNPGLCVTNTGLLSLPLSEDKVKDLIQQSHEAPCGKGTETVVDKAVRDTWEIEPDSIEFQNERWSQDLEGIVSQATQSLGVVTKVKAQLHRMLLYCEGQKFAPHRDTEKEPGMFATLVICLPSKHTGGAVTLRHKEEEKTFTTHESSRFGGTWMVWYTDVYHEITPVTSGCRWVLVYNLCHDSKTASRPTMSILDNRSQSLLDLLQDWLELRENQPQSLCWLLKHSYSAANIGWKNLKSDDGHRASHILDACARSGKFSCFLVCLEVQRTFTSDDEQWEENMEEEYFFSRIFDQGGQLQSTDVPAPDLTFIGSGVSLDRDPDTQWGGEYLGNQGSEICQIYRHGVLVIVPNIYLRHLFAQSSMAFEQSVLALIRRLQIDPEDEYTSQLLESFCQSALNAKHKSSSGQTLALSVVAMIAVFRSEPSLLDEAISKSPSAFASTAFKHIGTVVDFAQIDKIKSGLFTAIGKAKTLEETYNSSMAFLAGFREANPDRGSIAGDTVVFSHAHSAIFENLGQLRLARKEDARAAVALITTSSNSSMQQFVMYQGISKFTTNFCSTPSFVTALSIELCAKQASAAAMEDKPKEPQPYVSQLLDKTTFYAASFFDLSTYVSYDTRYSALQAIYGKALEHSLEVTFLNRVNSQMMSLKIWDSRAMKLVADLTSLVDPMSPNAEDFFRRFFLNSLENIVGAPPKKPEDFARPSSYVYCSCKLCRQLKDFLQDSTRDTTCFAAETSEKCYKWDYFWRQEHFMEVHDDKESGEKKVVKTIQEWQKKKTRWINDATNALETMKSKASSHGFEKYFEEMKADMDDWDRILFKMDPGNKGQGQTKTPAVIPLKRSHKGSSD